MIAPAFFRTDRATQGLRVASVETIRAWTPERDRIELVMPIHHPAVELGADAPALSVVPVLPPDLRMADLDWFYERVVDRNHRLRTLLELDAARDVVDNERRMLARAVGRLFANGLWWSVELGPDHRAMLSLRDVVERALLDGRSPEPYLRALALDGDLG